MKRLTLTLASVRFVHMAISSLVLISGYLFLAKVASSSCSCWEVKCVLCRRCLLLFLSFFPPSPSFAAQPSELSTPTPDSVLMGSDNERLTIRKKLNVIVTVHWLQNTQWTHEESNYFMKMRKNNGLRIHLNLNLMWF